MAPALGINVGFSAGIDGKIVSSSNAYNLDRSTSLQESTTIGYGEVSKDLTASGSGNNQITISSRANDKSASTEIESSGSFQTSAFTGASIECIGISQNTKMSGSYGGMTNQADSPKNKLAISSGFAGEGDLTADIYAEAGENAAISGNVEALGVEMLDDESMQIIGSGDIAMSVDGLYALSNGDLGNFGLSATNIQKEIISSDAPALITKPETTADGGRDDAYALLGYRWNIKDPQLKFVLRNDANLAAEGISASAMQSVIASAANTWDVTSNQNLFADSNLVTLNPTVNADSYNKINTIVWQQFPSTCQPLAFARTYYNSKLVDGYKTALESDLVFNANYAWSTDNTGVDIETVLLHEMGHTLGLADIYGKDAFKGSTQDIMYYYTGLKRTLGNGDKNAIWILYQ
jgi:hypothetical protein